MKKIVFATAAFSALTAAGGLFVGTHVSANTATPFAGAKAPNLKGGDPLPGNLFIELGRAINPGVVNVSTAAIPRNMGMRDPMMDMLERFYGVSPHGRANDGKPQPIGLGTGFIIRDDGLILTNAHVIRGADVVTIQLTEGAEKTYEAKVLGSDDRSDVALLQIKSDVKLTALALGSSETTQVGEWVAAFGNPFGHGHTMTKGIISSKGRSIEEINKFPLLQTDAPINPGNSGGPLVNMKGEVIGINSAINAQAQGISFAIPIDDVKRLIPQLEKGRLRKGYMGVGLGDVVSNTGEQAEGAGAGVASVSPGGPAAKAGLHRYDIITEFNGKKIHDATELMDAVSDTEPGKVITLKAQRQQGSQTRELSTKVTIAERPRDLDMRRQMREEPEAPSGTTAPFNLGFAMANLSDELRSQLDLPEDVKKPVIVDIANGSVASFVGMRPGDLILEVNRTEVSTVADVQKKLRKGENTLKLARGNRILIVSLSAPSR